MKSKIEIIFALICLSWLLIGCQKAEIDKELEAESNKAIDFVEQLLEGKVETESEDIADVSVLAKEEDTDKKEAYEMVAKGDIIVNNIQYSLELVNEKKKDCSRYELYLYDLNNTLIDSFDIDNWSEPLRFDKYFEILSEDYDNDGTPELLIGQYGCQNWNLYHMYTVSEDLKISEKENVPELTISEQDYSIILQKDEDKLIYSYYNNSKSDWVKKELIMWP